MISALRIAIMGTLLGLLVLAGPGVALAQTAQPPVSDAAAALAGPLTPEAIAELVARLSDQEVRDLLIRRLDTAAPPAAAPAVPAPEAAATGLVEDVTDELIDTAALTASTVAANVLYTPAAVTAEITTVRAYFAALAPGVGATFLWVLGLAIAVGWAVEALLVRFVLTEPRPDPTDPETAHPASPQSLWRRLWHETAGVIVFFTVVTVVLHLLMPVSVAPVAHIFTRWMVFLPRIGAAFFRFVLAPRRPDLRFIATDDWTARFLYRNFLGILLAIGFAKTLFAFNEAVGAAPALDRIGFGLNLIIFIWLAVVVLRSREGLKSIVRGRDQTLTVWEMRAAHAYPVFALVAIVATWLLAAVVAAMGAVYLLTDGRHIISLAIVLIAPLLDTLIRSLVGHLVPPMRGEGHLAEAAYQSNKRAYTRMGRVAVFGAVILLSARLWDVTLMNMAMASMGEQFAIHLIQALLICISGYFAWEIVRLLVNRKLANEQTFAQDVPGADGEVPHATGAMSSRLGTVLPPISWALQAVILVMTTLMALGNLGIDVTPLLAGAGIAGIAIGFGSQKLVSDVMSGLFFLADDAFRLNEYIDAGGTQGTVEKIALRSLQLRDAKGPVLTIPYSNISMVTNFGRDWGILKLRFTVPFDTDIEKVRKIFKKIGQEMMEDPVLAPGFIEPFKSQGVGEFNDVGIVVRGKFVHKPGTQFAIRRQIFKRVQEEFAANGIQFARREVRVSVSGQTALSEEELHKAWAAAAETVAQDERAAAAKAKLAGG